MEFKQDSQSSCSVAIGCMYPQLFFKSLIKGISRFQFSLLAFIAGALAGASVFFLSWAWQPALHSPHSLYSGSVGKVGRFVYVPYLLPFLAVCTTTNFSRRAKIP